MPVWMNMNIMTIFDSVSVYPNWNSMSKSLLCRVICYPSQPRAWEALLGRLSHRYFAPRRAPVALLLFTHGIPGCLTEQCRIFIASQAEPHDSKEGRHKDYPHKLSSSIHHVHCWGFRICCAREGWRLISLSTTKLWLGTLYEKKDQGCLYRRRLIWYPSGHSLTHVDRERWIGHLWEESEGLASHYLLSVHSFIHLSYRLEGLGMRCVPC